MARVLIISFIATVLVPVFAYASPECGEFTIPNDVLQTRIVNGELASLGEFPWQVSIQRQVGPRVQGGPRPVLGAASVITESQQDEDLLESAIWSQPFLARLNVSAYQDISNWPPPIPPLPTHPPDHHAPTHPPSLPTFPPNVKPWAPGAPQWPGGGHLPPYPPMPPVPTFPPSPTLPTSPSEPTLPPVATLPTLPTLPTSPPAPTLPTSRPYPPVLPSSTTTAGPTASPPSQPPRIRPPKPPVDRTQRWQHFCGGSIIENSWILTAGHCIENFKYSYTPGTIRVVAGTVNWKDVDSADSQVMLVDRVLVHPGWEKNLGQNDLALLHLATPVEYVQTDKITVNRVCLSRVMSEEHSGLATSSGWGFLSKDQRVTPDLMRRVDLPVVDHRTCRNAFSRVIGVSQLQVCAGQSPRGNCMGDSGGPLVQKQGNRATQIGIVSFSIPCAVAGYPDVFTRVSKFIDWISSSTGVAF